MNNEDYLGELGLILLSLVLILIFVPISCGILISVALGAEGLTYYTIVILVAVLLWTLLGIFYCKD